MGGRRAERRSGPEEGSDATNEVEGGGGGLLEELREEGRLEERWACRQWEEVERRGSARRSAVEVISGRLRRHRLVEFRFVVERSRLKLQRERNPSQQLILARPTP